MGHDKTATNLRVQEEDIIFNGIHGKNAEENVLRKKCRRKRVIKVLHYKVTRHIDCILNSFINVPVH